MNNILCSSSVFTNSNWFAFDEDKTLNHGSVSSEAFPSRNSEVSSPVVDGDTDEVILRRVVDNAQDSEVDDDTDEVILGGVTDSTKDSEACLLVSSKNSDETVLTNGPVGEPEDDIRPPTPDVKESQPECVEWRDEDTEPVNVAEKDIVSNFEVGSEKQVDATDDVKPGDSKLGEEKETGNSVGSSMPEAMAEEAGPVSPAVNSIKHPKPADDSTFSESSVDEQNHKKNENQGE